MNKSIDDGTLGAALRPRGPVQLGVDTRDELGVTVVVVSGELDVFTVPRLTSQLDEVVRRRQGDVVLDLRDTAFIDSLGLHTLLIVQRRLARHSRTLTVVCGDGAVRRAIELARLTETLGVVSTPIE